MSCCFHIHGNYIVVTRDMVWKLGELQSVYDELQFNVETASPYVHKSFEIVLINISTVRLSNSAVRRYCTTAHYTKNSLSSPCTSQHKHEQKDKTKTLVKFPHHVFIDFGAVHMSRASPADLTHENLYFSTT